MASVFLVTLAARFLVTPGKQGRLSTKRNPEKEPGRYPARMNQFDHSQTGRKARYTAGQFQGENVSPNRELGRDVQL